MLKTKGWVSRNLRERCISGVLSLSLLISYFISSAQRSSEEGLPFIKNYSPKDFNAPSQAWSVMEGNNGLMYFGIQGGILEYDGVKWKKVFYPSAAQTVVVRALSKDKNGRIYYGSYGDFGYLKTDSVGKMIAVSLLDEVPADQRGFFDIWSINIGDDGIYFQAREEILRMRPTISNGKETWKVKVWKPQTMFMYGFYPDGNFYAHQQGLGLYKLVKDSLELVPGSEFLGKERVQIMLPYTSPGETNPQVRKALVGMFYSGLYLFDGKTFTPFKTEVDPIIKSGLVLYKAIRLKSGNIALSTTGVGLLVIDDNGKLVRKINRSVGLQDESVYGAYISRNGTLWLALDNGISRVETASALTQFTLQSGISTSVLSAARYQGALYVGTTNGLLKYNPTKGVFESNKAIPQNQIFSLLRDGNELLVAGDGLFYVNKDNTGAFKKSIGGDLTLNSLYIPSWNPNLLLGGANNGIAVFQKRKSALSNEESWNFKGLIPGISDQVWTFAEAGHGILWAGTQNSYVFRIKFPDGKDGVPQTENATVEKLGEESGLVNALGAVFPTRVKPFFLRDSGFYTFSDKLHRFVVDTTFGTFNHGGANEDGLLYQDSMNRVWVRVGKETRLATPLSNGGYSVRHVLQQVTDRSFSKIFSEKGGVTWICTTDGLIRYDENISDDTSTHFGILLRHITAGGNVFNPDPGADQAPEISYRNNVLRFEYAAPFFDQEDKTQYQTWLEGFEKNWSAWDKNSYKEYTNLSAGKYRFHVRAVNIYRDQSDELVYEFVILPPWYATWWAYTLYALIFLFGVYLLIKWRTDKLKEQHKELEKTVEERTSQLSQRVAELAVINSVQEALVREIDMQGIYKLVGERIRNVFDAQAVLIATFDHNAGTENFQYAIEKGEHIYPGARPFDELRKKLIVTRQSILIKDQEQAYSWFKKEAIAGTRPMLSGIFTPLLVGEKVTGYISLQNVDRENAFSESDVKLLETLANSMSVALENARLFDETTRLLKETKQRSSELSVINSVQEGLAKELHMQAIYELVGDKLSEVMNTLDIDIRLFVPEKNQVIYPYVRDQGKLIEVAPSPMRGMSKYVYETCRTLIINENLEERMREMDSVTLEGTQIEKSFMAVPIMVGNNALGMVSISNYERENAFSDSEVRLLQTLVSAMSVALENARLFDETNRLLKETEQKTAELAVINSIQDGLVREMNVQSIYDFVGNRICQLFDTQTVIIRTFINNSAEEDWQFAIERGERLYSKPRPLIWANRELIKTKQAILINENYLEYATQHGGKGVSKGLPPKSAMFVPIIVGDSVRGSVSLQNVEKENAFTESDLRLLTTVTNSMSVALENARLFDETTHLLADAKQRATELSTVNSISKALASKLDINELIVLVGDQLQNLFKANIVYLALLDPKTKIINFPYQHGDNMAPMKLGEGLTSKIILSGEPLLINKNVDQHSDRLGLKPVGIPAASYLGVPIPVGDEIIGVLSVQSTEQDNRFNENDQRLLFTIAASVGVALRNAKLFEEVQQAKMEAESASKTAEKANAAKSAFLSTVSHELRTPLTSVLGFAKIIRKRLEEKIFPEIDTSNAKTEKVIHQVSENLQVVISEGERLTHLINDVLDLAKIEAGKMEWNLDNVSMTEVAERAIAATTSLFEQKSLTLIKEIDNNLPDITGDRDKLIQVIINLFSNAVKFTEQGSVTCKIYQDSHELIVRISDTGIGIAPEDFSAVFEQFKQVGGDTLTDKPKGTGLGLPICKEIIEHHGGRIWLESAPHKGSTFSFALPVIQSEAIQHPLHLDVLIKQLKEQVAHSRINGIGKTANILVVDDDDSIRSLLQQELGEAGYLIEEAVNGKQALECVRRNRPDLIILDIMMPEMNGFDVAAILKNDPQTMDIPIIVLSIVQDKARGYRIGVDRYLTKPIDTTELFAEVGTLLEQGKSKKKVMVVDEDSTAVRSLIDVLQQKGYYVVESDGKELVEKAISNKPDIIILNSMLSGKHEIVQSLRFEKGLENVLFLIYQ